jgi:hypothetical protein
MSTLNGPRATLRISKWEKWQSYRRDRGQPPWIKVHRCVMRNPEWVSLTDAQRGQLVAIWLLAADKDGVIPASPQLIKKLCHMDSEPDLQLFTELGFIEGCRQDDVKPTPERRHRDQAEAEAEKKKETDTSKPDEPVVDLWGVWLEELGGTGRKPTLTPKRKQKLRDLYREQLSELPDPLDGFRRILRAVQRSDHHMSDRAYQMPDSLFRNPERRDSWAQKGLGPYTNGKPKNRDKAPRKPLPPDELEALRAQRRAQGVT